jgi:hypothetical protein
VAADNCTETAIAVTLVVYDDTGDCSATAMYPCGSWNRV